MSLLGLFIFVSALSYYNGVTGGKSFKTRYGDIYDCVDFYKQPSFHHPVLKNHSFHHLMRPSFLVKSTNENIPTGNNRAKMEGCQVGTVPIRRITKDVLKMESLVAVNEPSGTYDAGVRTKVGSSRYGGGGFVVTVYDPPFVQPLAYSEARMKISSGTDAIQVGWRVDPSLQGDNLTRQYIYTDAGQSHCIDAQCGFVITNPKIPIDQVIEPVSQPGGKIWIERFNITRDQSSGNWWLTYSSKELPIGFWPKDIFTRLGDLASNVEWAGEVYSPPGVNEPPMGSGYRPNIDNVRYVAFFLYMTVVTENYTSVYADNLEEFATDRTLYDVKDKGYGGLVNGHYAFFGGARY